LQSDCKAIAKHLRKQLQSYSNAIANRSQSDCKVTAKRLLRGCKAIAKLLQTKGYLKAIAKATAKRLQRDCKAIENRLQSKRQSSNNNKNHTYIHTFG
jgi:hypothetical protein